MVKEYSNRILPRVFRLNKLRQFSGSTKLNVLDWLGNSPDLNPIENL